MFVYRRIAQYHETDQMGIIHHSNYVKWMEEARIAFLENVGMPYRAMEENGLVSPVVAVSVSYKSPVRFSDKVEIAVRLSAYSGVRLSFQYTFTNRTTGAVAAAATSEHCFLKDGRVVSVRKSFPETDAHLNRLLSRDTESV